VKNDGVGSAEEHSGDGEEGENSVCYLKNLLSLLWRRFLKDTLFLFVIMGVMNLTKCCTGIIKTERLGLMSANANCDPLPKDQII